MSEVNDWLNELPKTFPSGFTLIMVSVPSKDAFDEFVNQISFIKINRKGDLVLPENVVWRGFSTPSGEIAFYLSGNLSSQEIYEVISKAEGQHFQVMPQSFGDTATANLKDALSKRQSPPTTTSLSSTIEVAQKPKKKRWQFWKFGSPPDVEKLKARSNVKGLIKALSYKEDAKIREAAAETLIEIGDAQAVEPLIVALRDEDELVRFAAARALEQIGDVRVVEPFITALQDELNEVRRIAASALGKMGDARAVKPLSAALKDKDAYVCSSAAEALGEIGNAQAVEPLITALNKYIDWVIINAIAEALDKLGWQPDRSKTGAAYWAAKHEWDKCAELGALAVSPLILRLKDKSEFSHKDAAKTLEKIGAPALESLAAVVDNENNNMRVREMAAEIFDKIEQQLKSTKPRITSPTQSPQEHPINKQIAPLVKRLKDNSKKVRRSAIQELGELGDPGAVGPLISVLEDENEDRWVRSDAAEALGLIGDELAVEPLINALKNKDLYHGAAKGLGRIGNKRAIEPLNTLLQDNEIKLVAGKAIGMIETALGLIPSDWDYCENCGKTGAKLYQGGSYAFCSDDCRGEFGGKLSRGGYLQIHCPFCGFLQDTETGMSRGVRICIECRGNMDVLLEKA